MGRGHEGCVLFPTLAPPARDPVLGLRCSSVRGDSVMKGALLAERPNPVR